MTTAPTGYRDLVRPTMLAFSCPQCRAVIDSVPACPKCGFTGADTMQMFGGAAPAPLPVNDTARLWDERDLRLIRNARQRALRRFPQFRWSFCTVELPADTNLRLYGFWMLNVAPIREDESERDRFWTVLVLANVTDHRIAVVPAYAAELWLTNDMWDKAIEAMFPAWQADDYGAAVRDFMRAALKLLDQSWQRATAETPP